MTDTIFALATAPGRAAIAIIRLSGPGAGELLEALCGRRPQARHATLSTLSSPSGEVMDRALVLWFPTPNSFTGEDSAELHLHGGLAVVDAVAERLLVLGARPADPGEFTRRAFENGKLDLAQAEAVADLVDAETVAQRRQALAQLDGALGRRHEGWRSELIDILALLEAYIDFPDEDIPGAVTADVAMRIEQLRRELRTALFDAGRGERVRHGYRVAIIGAPNAGKSTLLNALLGREAAIVTPIPGTTRDVVEGSLHLGGHKVLLADTAGLRETGEPVEREGVRRAYAQAEAADLRILVVDRSLDAPSMSFACAGVGPGDVLVMSKTDLPSGRAERESRDWASSSGLLPIDYSGVDGRGLDDLTSLLEERVVSAAGGGEFPAATRERHRKLLTDAAEALERASGVVEQAAELTVAEVRLAAAAIGRVTGAVDAEQVLDRVFASFCIGK